jgi:NAD(P)-dependent dehydrogenase (short-subunit alcohol dehydrogenase family)
MRILFNDFLSARLTHICEIPNRFHFTKQRRHTMKLNNKVAIITGGSRGIGRGVAVAFANEGAAVAIVGRDKTACDETAAFITKNGGIAIGISADVSKEADVTNMVAQTIDKLHHIDLLVNSAAVNLPYRQVTEVTLNDWNWIIGINLTGIFLCCKAVLPQMKTQHFGKIINFSSIGGLSGAPGRSPYRATKAAIINFSECLAAEVKEFGIDVNTICPCVVETDMLRETKQTVAIANIPMPAEDMAEVTVFLASEQGRAITGTTINAFGQGNPLFYLPKK